jgi:hypothetical protein
VKTGAVGVIVFLLACTCAAAPKPTPPPAFTTDQPTKPSGPLDLCGTGHLPRVTEKSLTDGGLATFLASATKGTVAVDWTGTSARVVDRCRLAGRYVEAKGNGGWRFRATNRVLFRTDEIAGECRKATHVVAAYITQGAPVPSQMKAILVPLPCPPAKDSGPAPGCIARGLTGPERRKKAAALMTEIPPGHVAGADAAGVLEIFALIPDEDWGLTYATQLNTGDCSFSQQGEWLGSQYIRRHTSGIAEDVVELLDAPRRRPPPRLMWQDSNLVCLNRPVFLQCFAGQFEPIFGGPGFWTPVAPEKP